MANRNKAKGSSWERDVCKMLSNITGKNFQRVPNSGAFVGGMNAHRLKQMSEYQTLIFRGDIIPHEDYKALVIECKAYKEFQFHNLTSNVKMLDKWIGQLYVDIDAAEDATLIPLVIFKINNKGAFVVSLEGQYDYSNTSYVRYWNEERGKWFNVVPFNNEWISNNIKMGDTNCG